MFAGDPQVFLGPMPVLTMGPTFRPPGAGAPFAPTAPGGIPPVGGGGGIGIGPITIGPVGSGGPIGAGIPTPLGPVGFSPFGGSGCGCQPGTRCRWGCVETPLGGACIGGCAQLVTSGPIVPPSPVPQPGTDPFSPVTPVNGGGGNGGGAAAPPTSRFACALPNGRQGKPNKSGYFLRDGTFVAPGSRCVSRRSTNFANPDAAKRAVRRLEGHTRMLERTQKALEKIARRSPRRRSAPRRSRGGCGCG